MRCWKNLRESFLRTYVGSDSISQLFHFNVAWPIHQLSQPLSWCYSPNLTRKIKRNISYIVTSSQYFLSPANSKKEVLTLIDIIHHRQIMLAKKMSIQNAG